MLEQISVFLENKPGRLCATMDVLNDANIDIRAMSIADTADFGIVRVIVNDTEKALKALREQNFTAKVNEVIGFTIPDYAGALYEVIKAFKENDINIEYSYAVMGKNAGKADIVVRVENNEKATEVLVAKNIKLISTEDIINK